MKRTFKRSTIVKFNAKNFDLVKHEIIAMNNNH